MSNPAAVVINSDSNSESKSKSKAQATKRKYSFKAKPTNTIKAKIIKSDVINPKRNQSFATNEMEMQKEKLLAQVETLQKAIDLIKDLNSKES